MRILIGTEDVCGWISILKEELQKQGHTVLTIADPNRYFPERRHDLSNAAFMEDYVRLRAHSNLYWQLLARPLYHFSQKLPSTFSGRIRNYFRRQANAYFYRHTDLFIYLWNGLTTDDSDILEFKKQGARVITWFVGDDVRYYPEMQKQFGISTAFYDGYFKKSFRGLLSKLRIHERYADVIYSVPDQASLALRPYAHLQIPVQTEKLNFKRSQNAVPVLVHIPSSPQIKGTAIVRQAIEELRRDGLVFTYKELLNIPNTEVLRELSDADILVDELFLHGPGVLSFEAMGSGCAVATRYLEDSPACFRPPVVSITEHNIKAKLTRLITDKAWRDALIEEGRAYVSERHTAAHIVRDMMARLEAPEQACDYVPAYFRNSYVPEPENVAFINALTDSVAREAWYREHVPAGTRGQLIF